VYLLLWRSEQHNFPAALHAHTHLFVWHLRVRARRSFSWPPRFETERSHAFLKDIALEGYFVSFNKRFRNNLSFNCRTVFILLRCVFKSFSIITSEDQFVRLWIEQCAKIRNKRFKSKSAKRERLRLILVVHEYLGKFKWIRVTTMPRGYPTSP